MNELLKLGISEGVAALLALVVAVLLVLFAMRFLARRASVASQDEVLETGPSGAGAALAMALDGDLGRARQLLEKQLREPSIDQADILVGLIGVLRAQGELNRAMMLIDQWTERVPSVWAQCLRIRLALDNGDVDKACTLVLEERLVNAEMAVGALVRGGRWEEAVDVYRDRTPKKARSSQVEANLTAALAAESYKDGRVRLARKLIKKAASMDANAFLVQLVGQILHPKRAERVVFRANLDAAFPGLEKLTGWGSHAGHENRSILEDAKAQVSAGQPEAALATLRQRLDEEPRDWPVRQAFGQLVVDLDEPKDWRAELRDLLSVLPEPDATASELSCGRCGLAMNELVLICPRCDALGSVVGESSRESSKVRYVPESVGTSVRDLLAGLDLTEESTEQS